ncbi:MAG: helix-turn-helix transcriptional regulator [Clostridia bacterium]|nr:helix-turn-helix transcriptional regulator [Clostridia bacterium]
MISIEQEKFIKQYVSNEYFDVDKLLAYLKIHDVVGMEVFDLVKKRNIAIKLRMVEENYGFTTISTETFIRRVPFYFYVDNYFKGEHGSLLSIIHDIYSRNYLACDYEPIYVALEKLFYEYNIRIPQIFTYISEQASGDNGSSNVLFQWVKYLDYCQEINIKHYFPKSIIYAYNTVLEKKGLQPIIYQPGLVGYNEDFLRIDNEILIGGEFPCDENGIPELKWIGIWIENAKYLRVKECISYGGNITTEKELYIGLTPYTKIYLPNIYNDETDEEDIWYPIYFGSNIMEFDRSALKYFRKNRRLKQQEVADAVGVQLRTYQKWEKGETVPDGENLIRLMNYLNIPSVQDFIKNEPIYDNGFLKFRARSEYGVEHFNVEKRK